jgi:hypothetical protein
MRALIIAPLCLAVAACGGGGEEKKKEEAAAATMAAGQWETTYEVTSMRSADKTEPALKAAVGDKETGAACIEAGKETAPEPALFAGPGNKCSYKNSYIRNGRITASLSCRRSGVEGELMMTVEGKYTGTTFEGTVSTQSYLPGRGDFEMSRKMSGRQTGATCQAAAPAKSA